MKFNTDTYGLTIQLPLTSQKMVTGFKEAPT